MATYCGLRRFRLGRDDQLARHRRLAVLDPHLPIDVSLANRQVMAVNTADPARPDVAGPDDALPEILASRHLNEICERQLDSVTGARGIQHSALSGRRGRRGVDVLLAGEDRQRLPIVEELEVAIVALHAGMKAIGQPTDITLDAFFWTLCPYRDLVLDDSELSRKTFNVLRKSFMPVKAEMARSSIA